MSTPPHKRPKSPHYLLDLAQQLSRMMRDQDLKIQDIEKALEIIKVSRDQA